MSQIGPIKTLDCAKQHHQRSLNMLYMTFSKLHFQKKRKMYSLTVFILY